MSIMAFFVIAPNWNQSRYPSLNEWFDELEHIYAREHYSAIERNELLTHTTIWMNLEEIMLSEKSQFQKVTYHMIPLIDHCKTFSISSH